MWKNIKAYLQGSRRQKLMNTWFQFLIPKHIQEQYRWRFKRADKRCHRSGKCIACGCKMPAVLLADKGCRVNCYPPMMDKEKWRVYKLNNNIGKI